MTRRGGRSARRGGAGAGSGNPGSGDRDDARLRDLFAALRREDRQAAPQFDRLLSEARPGSERAAHAAHVPGWLWVEALAGAAALVALLFLVVPWSPHHHDAHTADPLAEALAQARAIDAWRAPTDSLLEVAILKIPDTVPTLEFTSVALPALATPSASDATQRRKR
jgi:hypothetical protein